MWAIDKQADRTYPRCSICDREYKYIPLKVEIKADSVGYDLYICSRECYIKAADAIEQHFRTKPVKSPGT